MSGTTTRTTLTTVALLVAWTCANTVGAWPWSKTVKVWEDDAHTRKIEVRKLDPDEIAEKEWTLLFGSWSVAGIGVGAGYSEKKGIEYDAQAQKLIDALKELVKDFNKGKMSLETYNRRKRELYAAGAKARQARLQLFMLCRQESQKAFVRLNKELGLPVSHIKERKANIEDAMREFAATQAAVRVEAKQFHPAPVHPGTQSAKATLDQMIAANASDVDNSLSRLQKAIVQLEKEPKREMIKIWREDAKRKRITVPKLDADKGVEDIAESLRMQPYAVLINVGPKATWSLKQAKRYDTGIQTVIVKYRQLCMEYNSDLVSQESYLRRLRELYDAERMAQRAQLETFLLMRKQASQAFKDLDSVLAKEGVETGSDAEDDLANMAKGMSKKAWKDDKPKDSVVRKMSQDNRLRVEASMTAFETKAADVKVRAPKETVDVWVTDAKRRKVTVPKLDTDEIAQTVKRELSFRITLYSFGPELTWAKNKGLEYDRHSQMLIVKYKQLCMDYNAGLVSQESYHRRRKEIDAAVKRGRQLREQMFLFMRMLAKEAFDELDAEADMMR